MRIDIAQLEFIDKTLRVILVWLEKETGLEFTDTSLVRINDPGTHGTLPLRAVDLRCRLKWLGKAFVRYINKNWKYDPDRPHIKVAKYHDVGKGAHLHIQTHPNTSRIL